MRSPQGPRGFQLEQLESRRLLAAIDAVAPPLALADSWSPTAWPHDVNWIQQQYGLTGAGQTVAVIDSGIAYDHYALGGGLGASYRVVGGWDFAENDADPYDDAPGGFHGTHVAGIIASSDSQFAGVAPEVDLVGLRVFNDLGESSFTWIEQALGWVDQHQYAFEFPITTVNLSLGSALADVGATQLASIDDKLATLESKGIFVAVSAGNQFEGTTDVTFPASSSHVVPVASVGANGRLSSFSQRNSHVLAAPGEQITSTVPDYLFGFDGVTDDFLSVSGTSAAAPHVAAASVLVREALQFTDDHVTPKEIAQHLRNTADLIHDSVTGADYRRVNLSRALQQAFPDDDHGNDAATATSLGVVSGVAGAEGALHELSDVDFFSLTAAATGTLNVAVSSTDLAEIEIESSAGVSLTGTETIDVTAGEHHLLSLRSQLGIGHYSVTATLIPDTVDTLPAAPASGLSESHLRWVPTEAGVYEIDLRFDRPQQVIEVVLYDQAHAAVFWADQVSPQQRFTISVGHVQSYELVVLGRGVGVEFNAVSLASGTGRPDSPMAAAIDVAVRQWAVTHGGLDSKSTAAAVAAFIRSPLPAEHIEEAIDFLCARHVVASSFARPSVAIRPPRDHVDVVQIPDQTNVPWDADPDPLNIRHTPA